MPVFEMARCAFGEWFQTGFKEHNAFILKGQMEEEETNA